MPSSSVKLSARTASAAGVRAVPLGNCVEIMDVSTPEWRIREAEIAASRYSSSVGEPPKSHSRRSRIPKSEKVRVTLYPAALS